MESGIPHQGKLVVGSRWIVTGGRWQVSLPTVRNLSILQSCFRWLFLKPWPQDTLLRKTLPEKYFNKNPLTIHIISGWLFSWFCLVQKLLRGRRLVIKNRNIIWGSLKFLIYPDSQLIRLYRFSSITMSAVKKLLVIGKVVQKLAPKISLVEVQTNKLDSYLCMVSKWLIDWLIN
jgi:hypothetical protein